MPFAPTRLKLIRKFTTSIVGAAALSMLTTHAHAQAAVRLTSSSVDRFDAAGSPGSVFAGKRSRDVFIAQVMLDRAHFSPGEIDGYFGSNTSRAVKAWQQSKGMVANGKVDASLISALRGEQNVPDLKHYSVSEADLIGPFGELPDGMVAMAELKAVHFESAVEGLAEKFHMSPDLLHALNPDIANISAGDDIVVAATNENPIDGTVTRIEIYSAEASLRAFGADGRLLASYPATVGSADFPSPSGTMEVRTLAPTPAYYFSPEGREWGPDKKLTIAPGPNNPVGSTWIDLTKEGYGIHGTPDPQNIGKTASHGCVRLTNWDAHELGKSIEAGTTVEFL